MVPLTLDDGPLNVFFGPTVYFSLCRTEKILQGNGRKEYLCVCGDIPSQKNLDTKGNT